jgi:hypothetical protein
MLREKQMLKVKYDVFYMTTTRFNNKTYNENYHFRNKHNFSGCIYNVPREMPNYIPLGSKVFVIEMNNDKDIIMGIGYLYNILYKKKYLKIYEDMNYNRYSYVSKHRVDRNDMNDFQLEKLKVLENLVFKGKTHLKRGQGITSITQEKVDKYKKFILKFMIDLFSY